MNDFNEHMPNPIEEPKKKRNQGKSGFKGFMTTIAGGIIGSVLTLTIVPHIDYIEDIYSSVEKKVSQISEKDGNNRAASGAVTVQKTAATSSATSTASVADMVEEASKSIVGIVNMQTQTQRSLFS